MECSIILWAPHSLVVLGPHCMCLVFLFHDPRPLNICLVPFSSIPQPFKYYCRLIVFFLNSCTLLDYYLCQFFKKSRVVGSKFTRGVALSH